MVFALTLVLLAAIAVLVFLAWLAFGGPRTPGGALTPGRELAPGFSDARMLEAIGSLFGAHGVLTSLRDGWLVPLLPSGPAIQTRLTTEAVTEKGATVRLDVLFAVSEAFTPVESFAGFGATLDDAADNALDGFIASSLHVLLAALYGHLEPSQVTIEQWLMSGEEYDAIIGHYVTRTFAGPVPPLGDDVLPSLKGLVCALPGTEQLYWLRMFYANFVGGEQLCEVLLNNQTWEEAQSAVAALPWETRDSSYSVRLFLVLKKLRSPQRSRRVPGQLGAEDMADPSESYLQMAREAMQLYGMYPDANEKAVADELVASGYSPPEAALMAAIVPSACSRPYLEKMGVRLADEFRVATTKGEWVPYSYERQPISRAAMRVAAHVYRYGVREDVAESARRSAELGVVSKALDAGDSADGGTMYPPSVYGVTAEELGELGRTGSDA
jgi:hypothetical protein